MNINLLDHQKQKLVILLDKRTLYWLSQISYSFCKTVQCLIYGFENLYFKLRCECCFVQPKRKKSSKKKTMEHGDNQKRCCMENLIVGCDWHLEYRQLAGLENILIQPWNFIRNISHNTAHIFISFVNFNLYVNHSVAHCSSPQYA